MRKILLFILVSLTLGFILYTLGFLFIYVLLDDEWGMFLMSLAGVPICISLGMIIAPIYTNKKEEGKNEIR